MPVVSTAKMPARQFLRPGEDPPGVRLELVDGEVAVSPSPTPNHSDAAVQLISTLGAVATRLGQMYVRVNVVLTPFTVRSPDVVFYTTVRTHLIGRTAMEGPPDLAV